MCFSFIFGLFLCKSPREPARAHALRCPKDSSLEQLSELVGRSMLLQVAVDFI
jgi:hypothetical protein